MNLNKGIPHSLEAEAYVLGSILIEPNLAIEFCSRLAPDDFYNPTNKLVYTAIEYLFRQKKEVNIINTIETLKLLNKYDDVGEQYLIDLTDAVPSIVTTETYVDVLKDKSLERELYYEVNNISKKIIEGDEEVNDLLKLTSDNISKIVNKQRTGDLKLISSSINKVLDIIESNRQKSADGSIIGIDTGYQRLNEFTYGFQPGELIILAARPGIGKSALALNIAHKMCKNSGKKVAFFSLEMGIDQLVMRLLSISSNVKLSTIRSGSMNADESSKILNARVELDTFNFYIDETTNNNMEDIKIKCRKLKRANNLDFIIIDYLQLLTASNGKQKMNRYEEVSSLSRSLKLLARELEVPVLALSQLSRAVETRNADKDKPGVVKKPILSDLRESGSIEQDADIVLFLHRETVNDDPTKRPTSMKVECIIAKNRQGMTGSFMMLFRGDCSAFEQTSDKKNPSSETE